MFRVASPRGCVLRKPAAAIANPHASAHRYARGRKAWERVRPDFANPHTSAHRCARGR